MVSLRKMFLPQLSLRSFRMKVCIGCKIGCRQKRNEGEEAVQIEETESTEVGRQDGGFAAGLDPIAQNVTWFSPRRKAAAMKWDQIP